MTGRRRLRTATLAFVTAVGATGITALVVGGGSGPAPRSLATGPIEGNVHTIKLWYTGTRATTTAQDAPAFSLLGVAWDAPGTRLRATVRVRTRSATTGTWSAWRPITVDTDDAPDGTASERSRSGATAPLWVGPSSGVAVRVAGRRTLPAGLRVVLVDPGDRQRRPVRAMGHAPVRIALAADTVDPSAPVTDSPNPSASASAPVGSTSPAAPSSTAASSATASPSGPAGSAPRPAIVSRAGWGAKESLVTSSPKYGKAAKVVFVHQTDTGNGYSCADSAAVVRSIFLYHVKTNGWNDIAYNFLVDKCGKLYEGRAGGVARPVIGAHTYGFNTNSAGVAVLGTFTKTAPPRAAVDAVARIAAWKLGLSGGNPTGHAKLIEGAKHGNFKYKSSVDFHTIAGHKDANSTKCPGKLYGALGGIRTTAKRWTTPADLTSVSVGGATRVSGAYYTKGTVTLGWRPAAVTGYTLLDGGTTIAQIGASALSVTKTLSAGEHHLQVVAANIDGSIAKSAVIPVITDVTKPVFGAPVALSVRAGTAASTEVPVKLGWKVTDDRVLRSVKATSPSAKTFTPTTTSWSTYAKPGKSTAWSVTAADAAGNTATNSATRTASISSDSSAARTGTWKTTSSDHYLGGSARYAGTVGATASWTVTARSVGLITKRSTTSGAFSVYVDGVPVATIDTKASSTLYRQIQWTQTWSGSGKHTITVKVEGTSGRPTVTIDGLAYVH